MHKSLMERAVNAFERDISSGSTKEGSSEDQLFGELMSVKLSKRKGDNDKEDTKMQILQLQQTSVKEREKIGSLNYCLYHPYFMMTVFFLFLYAFFLRYETSQRG